MFRSYNFANMASRAIVIRKNNTRFVSFHKLKETFKHLLGTDSNRLPYKHVCQIGDPVLRGHAMKIEPEILKLADFQKVIIHLINIMRRYEACGMSGPQIGLPWQIFAIEYTEDHMKTIHDVVKKVHEVEIIPVTIFINPELKVIDHTPIILHEGCESVRGYSAAVPRAYEVEITALNTSAEQFIWRGRGWSARIAQHEYDHLQNDSGKKCCYLQDVIKHNCDRADREEETRDSFLYPGVYSLLLRVFLLLSGHMSSGLRSPPLSAMTSMMSQQPVVSASH